MDELSKEVDGGHRTPVTRHCHSSCPLACCGSSAIGCSSGFSTGHLIFRSVPRPRLLCLQTSTRLCYRHSLTSRTQSTLLLLTNHRNNGRHTPRRPYRPHRAARPPRCEPHTTQEACQAGHSSYCGHCSQNLTTCAKAKSDAIEEEDRGPGR
jgi:hypothetical protein